MLSFLRRKRRTSYRAHFAIQGQTIEVAPHETLLQAALAAGLPHPHSCRVGSCATCRCRLVAGKVKELTDTSYVLDGAQRRAGSILACQTLLLSDVRIEVAWPGSAVGETPISGRIASLRELTADIVEMTIDLTAPMRYVAGQHARVGVPSLDIARSYSFACAPDREPQSRVQFYVRRAPGGRFTRWLATATVGVEVEVAGPEGSFALSSASAPLLFIAGGSGLAPIKAILEQAHRDGCTRDAILLFGARTARDLYALQEIETIAAGWMGCFRFVPVLSHEPESSDWSGARGLVTDGLQTRLPDLHTREAYLCGPPAMVDAATDALRACGVSAAAIRSDSFVVNGP